MSNILNKIFGKAGGSVVDKIAGVADRFIRTKDEKAEFEKQMTEIMIDAEAAMQKNVTERWKADLELLIYLDCKSRFTRNNFIDGTYTYSWDKNRWERLRKDGWIEVWRHRNRTTIKYSIYKTSFKSSQLISRIYRILLGEEDLPTSERNVFYNNKSYTDKVFNKSIDDMIKDKDR